MGKGDATKTFGIFLTLPTEWKPKLETRRRNSGALSLQDVVRSILAENLKGEDSS